MIMDFVTFEIALKLKEKGFMERCLAYYDVDDNVGLLYNTQYTDEILPCQYEDLLQCHNTEEAETQSDDSGTCVDAPTISQVMKWLRKEKNFHLMVYILNDSSEDADGRIIQEWFFWSFGVQNCNSGDYAYEGDDVEYESYEEAALAGIEYVLYNLI